MSSTAHLIQMFELDRRARSCVGGRSKRGQEEQALGRSRGGFTTKIHAKSDASGDISAFDLTGGEAFDGRRLENPARHRARHSAPRRHLRQRLRQQGQPGRGEEAPHRSRHSRTKPTKGTSRLYTARTPYKARVRIEHGVGRLKRFKQVALRCEKTTRNFNQGLQIHQRLCEFFPQRAATWPSAQLLGPPNSS